MTRETKVGLLMVAVVVGVFGFLVYKRVHRPIEGFADQITREEAREVAREDVQLMDQRRDNELFVENREPPRQVQPERSSFKKRERAVVRDVEKVVEKVEDFADAVVEEIVPVQTEKRPRTKQRMPVELTTDDDDFAQFAEPRKNREEPRRIQSPEPVEDAFETTQQAPMQPPQSTQLDQDTPASDPFGDVTSDTEVKTVQFDESPQRESRSSYVEAEIETAVEAPRRVQEYEESFDSTPRNNRRRAAAEMVIEDRPARDPEFQVAVSGDKQNYVVQPNDNFWSISRKVYGAGRYYKALAKHNQQIISDPQMMRPGVVISTPHVSVLEQRFAELIPKAASNDSVTSVSTTQSRKPAETEPAGYFVTNEGSPMYRVGENDTLTGIAKSHLGRTSRWVQILEMNRNVLRDGNELKIGTVLRLPADASRVQVVGTARDYR